MKKVVRGALGAGADLALVRNVDDEALDRLRGLVHVLVLQALCPHELAERARVGGEP